MNDQKRYTALRIIGTIYKVLGAASAVITLLLVLGSCLSALLGGAMLGGLEDELGGALGGAGIFFGIISAVILLLYGGMISVTMFGLGEGVYLLISLEENTRRTAEMLERTTAARGPAADR